jgi:COMPASS component SWD3
VHDDNPPVTSVCFSPNGRFVLAWSQDSCIRLWDYVAGSVKKTYQGHINGNFTIGGCFGVLQREAVSGLALGDGLQSEQHGEHGRADAEEEYPFIASASEDGDVVLWDVRSKAVIQRVHGHEGVCFWVDVHGDTMVSGGQDGTIKIYRHRRPGARGTQLDRWRNGEIPSNADQVPTNGVNGHNGMPDDPGPGLKPDTPQQEQDTRQVELSLRQEELKAED